MTRELPGGKLPEKIKITKEDLEQFYEIVDDSPAKPVDEKVEELSYEDWTRKYDDAMFSAGEDIEKYGDDE